MKRTRKSSKTSVNPYKITTMQSKSSTTDSKGGSEGSTSGTNIHIDDLPSEMLCYILSFLTIPEQLKLATVSHRWQQAVDACLARCRRFSKRLVPRLRHVSDEMLEKMLSRMPALRSLGGIPGFELDVNIIGRHCPHLEDLDLYLYRVDVPSLERLCRSCPKLTALTLSSAFNDECVETLLRGLPELRSLDLELADITGRCLALLPATLQRLALCGDWNLLPAELDKAGRCPALKELDISFLDDQPSEGLGRLLGICPGLERLNSRECDITDDFIKQLPKKTPGIRKLNLSACGELTEAGLMSLGRLKELRKLDLFDTESTDAVLKQLQGAFHLTELTVGSDAYHEKPFSEKALARVVLSCPSLKKVVLGYGVEVEELIERLTGQLSADRDVRLVVPPGELDDLEVELPEDGPLRVDTYSSEDDEDDD